MPHRRYILDTNVFIQAKNLWYGFDIAPGFWKLIEHHGGGKLVSLKCIKDELNQGRAGDPLVDWVHDRAPAGFFLPHDDAAVSGEYRAMMQWVMANPQFDAAAKAKFAAEADCFLAAYAKAHGPANWTVVTQEVYAPEARTKVPLPNVCRQFGVRDINTIQLMRELRAALDWSA